MPILQYMMAILLHTWHVTNAFLTAPKALVGILWVLTEQDNVVNQSLIRSSFVFPVLPLYTY